MNRDVLQRLIASTVDTAIRRMPVPTWRPGTVTAVASVQECTVRIDGDNEAGTSCHPGGLPVAAGDRVMVLFYPPRGVMVAARLDRPTAYALNVGASATAIGDAVTFYFGSVAGRPPTTTSALYRVYIPRAGTIRVAYILGAATTVGTAEAWPMYVRVNDTTSYLIESLAVSTATRVWSNTAMQVPVEQGDFIEIESVAPTWATNPVSAFGGTLLIA